MTIYIVNVILSWIFASIAQKNKDDNYRVYKVCLFLIVLFWSVLFAVRYNVGTDSKSYFDRYYYRIGDISLSDYLSINRDFLFSLVEWVCHKVFGGYYIPYAFVIGLLCYLPYFFVFKQSNSKEHTVLYVLGFIFLGYFTYPFNAVRQGIAVAFSFYAYECFFLKKKYIKYALIMAIAFGFHTTALFILPIHFVTNVNYKKFGIGFILFVCSVVFYLNFWRFWQVTLNALASIGFGSVSNDYIGVSASTANGANILHFLIYLAPLFVLFITRNNRIETSSDYEKHFLLCFFATFLMLLSYRTWILARFAFYFGIYFVLMLPELKYSLSGNGRQSNLSFIYLLYFISMVVLLLSGDSDLYPYAAFPAFI